MAAKYAHSDEHGRYQNAHGRRYYLKGGKPFDSVWDIPSIAPTLGRAHGLPDAEAAGTARTRDRRDHRPGFARDRPLRRQRHDCRRRAATRPPLRRRRLLAAGHRGRLRQAGTRGGHTSGTRSPALQGLILVPRVSTIARRETSAWWRTSVRTDESGHPAGECMYQYSRAIFLAVKNLVDESQPGVGRVEAQRRVLAACEAAVERLAADPRYFARPDAQPVRGDPPLLPDHAAGARVCGGRRGHLARRRGRRGRVAATQRSARPLPGADAQGPAMPARRDARERVLPVACASRRAHRRRLRRGLSGSLERQLELRLARELADVHAE